MSNLQSVSNGIDHGPAANGDPQPQAAPPPVVTDPDGRRWILFDGFQIAPAVEKGGVMVIFGYKGAANVVLHIPNITIASTDPSNPEQNVLQIAGLEGRQQVLLEPVQPEAA